MMDLYVRRNSDDEIFVVRKYVKSENPDEHLIWCNDWYGKHIIGEDCKWHVSHDDLIGI